MHRPVRAMTSFSTTPLLRYSARERQQIEAKHMTLSATDQALIFKQFNAQREAARQNIKDPKKLQRELERLYAERDRAYGIQYTHKAGNSETQHAHGTASARRGQAGQEKSGVDGVGLGLSEALFWDIPW